MTVTHRPARPHRWRSLPARGISGSPPRAHPRGPRREDSAQLAHFVMSGVRFFFLRSAGDASDRLQFISRSRSLSGAELVDPRAINSAIHIVGGTNRQMRRMARPSPGRMHACMRPAFDALRGKVVGTTAVPCLVVTTIAGSSFPSAVELIVPTFSTGAQSMP